VIFLKLNEHSSEKSYSWKVGEYGLEEQDLEVEEIRGEDQDDPIHQPLRSVPGSGDRLGELPTFLP
jgi:hypothetical protein